MKIAVYTNILRVRVLAHRCAEELKSPVVRVCPADGMDDWAQVRAEADLHLFLWMGTGLDRPFLQRASAYLRSGREIPRMRRATSPHTVMRSARPSA